MLHTHPIVALATPVGMGAIGVIRLSGVGAIELADAVFKGKRLSKQASHTAHVGLVTDKDGTPIDQVVATIFRTPRSYTGQDTVEISCHGSNYILQRVMERLVSEGAQLAQAGEFTLRAFLNGKMDLSQAEAVADLIASENEAMRRIALLQMRSGFASQLSELRQQLVQFAALIELELDFSTEDVEFADRRQLRALVEQIRHVLYPLIASFRLGNVIKNGVHTVIAGRPNAGKSTLLNALLNEERAIVSPIAGTTRDTIEEILHIEGMAFRLIDTAGIREANDAIEQMGVQKTMEKIGQATVLLYVFDASTLPLDDVGKDLEKLHRNNLTTLVIANKADQLHTPKLPQNIFPNDFLLVSAKEQTGLGELRAALCEAATGKQIAIGKNEMLLTNVRHYEALSQADKALDAIVGGIDTQRSSELIAQDLRTALDYIGQITGDTITNDEVLGNIFSKFCIGK